METLLDRLNKEISKDKYYLDESGEIILEKVKTSALNLDDHLLNILLNNEEFKKTFFVIKDNVLIFDKIKFAWLISNSDFLPNSYTSFKNKIGLINANGDFLKNNNDVCLSFPFKDCVLEFDSTDEDEDRNEIFLNEILASDCIDTLLSPKAFSNPKLYSKDGQKGISSFNNENLIIKGNNLIALHSLLDKYRGAIKLMYWDILYNTKDDRVPYNDSFKHSSWLTMMKNRLMVAKDLLTDNGGTIVIQIDYNEMAYLKVLCDEIFKGGYIATVTVKTSSESGVKVNANKPIKTSEYLLIYTVNKDKFNYKHPRIKLDTYDKNYKYFVSNVKDDYHKWKITNLKDECAKELGLSPKKLDNQQLLKFQIDHCDNVFSVRDISNALKNMIKEKNIDRDSIYLHVTSTGKKTLLYKNGEIVFASNKIIIQEGEKCLSKMASDIWTDISWDGIAGEGSVELKNGKKPEKLLHRLIEALTEPGEIVLDAYFGTGTTGSVALKTGRKFIGIEQLNTHFDKSIDRLCGVINGEQTGISKEMQWKGGGSFIAVEIMKRNQNVADNIAKAKGNDLDAIYKELINSPFVLNYKIDLDIIKDPSSFKEFSSIDDDSKKKILLSMIEKNTLYFNYSDIDDSDYKLTDEDKSFSKSFYKNK